MPIYEFECAACGECFEELVLGGRSDVKCPKCASPEVRKKLSAFAFKSGATFVGTGKTPGGGGCSGCSSSNCGSCGG
ncbi:zinc ribbon domain-containing protein [Dissulfurirhabdus thermomarina]|uniref:Zinc ribbon domain-containing protein n=1 Tax=Dissulfurirhabdus thermomarina TaxID=1765737 RepID=A0A6N9TP35_DISTH|nr:zinc ribbon domain-containing protein [Dissulfurirhabdus thermomarina]NDY42929.1 zinc ribbon domain-containing protein [Dissulfurirhabdus thermomarina]NMX23217.1 zinc ribbon domain-containing protein [Dissulfurirhabdus thermomarina]